MSRSNQRTSEILQAVITRSDDGPISLRQFVEMLGERAFALVILMLALPNSLPIPGIPGFSTLTGLPVAFIAWQMICGREYIWLPYKLSRRQFSQDGLKRLVAKALPSLSRIEKFLMPRWQIVCSPLFERLLGVMFLILALIISLPIPGGNFLPGLSMSLLALGLLEKDGLFVTCALGFSLMSIILMYKVIIYFFTGLGVWVAHLF